MLVTKTTEIYVPLMETEFENYFEKFDLVLDELCLLSNTTFVHFNEELKIPLKIERLKPEEVEKIFKTKKQRNFTKWFLKFSTQYTFTKKSEIALSFAVTHLTEMHVNYLLIYLNLAKPGAFDSRAGITISRLKYGTKSKTEKGEFPMLVNVIHMSLDITKSLKWPPIRILKIKDTLEWLENHWEAFTTVPRNRIERALNAFSYLFHDNLRDNSPSDLFFSLMGIEAIYVEGNQSVQKQVDIKSQIFLGKRNEFKKKFNELYDFRSRFIHGQLNFLNKYFIDNADTNVEKHLTKTYDNSELAVLILLSSIQQHILRNKTELEFDLVLRD